MNKKRAIYIIIPFLIAVFGIGILNVINKDKEISFAENRTLQSKPAIENIKNKDYGTVYEKYYTDQFIYRDELLKLYTSIELNSNKSNVKGYYITDDNWVLEDPAIGLDDDYANYIANVVNKYATNLEAQGKDTYYVSTSHKTNALSEKYPNYVYKDASINNKNKFLQLLDSNKLEVIDITDEFKNKFSMKELENFYFKTDHHWNSIGAYEAFKLIVEKVGKDNQINIDIKDTDYDVTYIPNKKFLGSYNLNLYSMMSKDEKLPYVYKKEEPDKSYYLNIDKKFVEVETKDIFGTYTHEDELTHAGSYTMDDINYKIVNENPLIDKKVLIFRDSYHSAMSWLLGDVFREVEVVDPRHVAKFDSTNEEIAYNSDADIVMFMFNDLYFKDIVNLLDNTDNG